MPRHQFTDDDRKKGGETRYNNATKEEWSDMSSKGFWATVSKTVYGRSKHFRAIVKGYKPVWRGK